MGEAEPGVWPRMTAAAPALFPALPVCLPPPPLHTVESLSWGGSGDQISGSLEVSPHCWMGCEVKAWTARGCQRKGGRASGSICLALLSLGETLAPLTALQGLVPGSPPVRPPRQWRLLRVLPGLPGLSPVKAQACGPLSTACRCVLHHSSAAPSSWAPGSSFARGHRDLLETADLASPCLASPWPRTALGTAFVGSPLTWPLPARQSLGPPTAQMSLLSGLLPLPPASVSAAAC